MLRIFRDHLAKYFIIAALLAFMATIFFSWGMGTLQGGNESGKQVGIINGKDLDYKQFLLFRVFLSFPFKKLTIQADLFLIIVRYLPFLFFSGFGQLIFF